MRQKSTRAGRDLRLAPVHTDKGPDRSHRWTPCSTWEAIMRRLCVILALTLAGLALAVPAQAIVPPTSGTFFYVTSDPGDPIGRGQELLYTPDNATFSAGYVNGYFEGHVNGFDGNYWSIFMEAPDGFDLVPGTTYADLILWPFNFSSNYGLSVQGFGSACSSLGAGSQMTINELTRQAQFPNPLTGSTQPLSSSVTLRRARCVGSSASRHRLTRHPQPSISGVT